MTTDRPAIAHAPLSVILPVRDQAAVLEAAVKAWFRHLNDRGKPFEFLIVDDGSTDATPEIASKIANVTMLRHDTPRGFGACLRTGLAAAQHPLLFYTALDYPYQPADLRKLMERINEADIVSGYRAMTPVPTPLKWAGRVLRLTARVLIGLPLEPLPGWLGGRTHLQTLLARHLFGVPIRDPDSAFKLIRRDCLSRCPLQSDGSFAHTELLAKANFVNAILDEVPLSPRSGPFKAAPWPAEPPGLRRHELARLAKRGIRVAAFLRDTACRLM